MRKIRQGDDVVVLTGKDKGKRGTVLRVLDKERVVVENVNMVKKHQKISIAVTKEFPEAEEK